MNVIARLEYELAYYDSAIHRFNHYTTRTPPNNKESTWIWMFRRSLSQVVNFQSGVKSDVRKNGERKKMFLKSTYSFFLFFLLWSGSGSSRKIASAFNSRADVILAWSLYLCASLSLFCSHWPGSQKSWVFISPHRLQTRHSTILLIFGATASHWLL